MPSGWYYSDWQVGEQGSIGLIIDDMYGTFVGAGHTHGDDRQTARRRTKDEVFSDRGDRGDKFFARKTKRPLFLATPQGKVLMYDPITDTEYRLEENPETGMIDKINSSTGEVVGSYPKSPLERSKYKSIYGVGATTRIDPLALNEMGLRPSGSDGSSHILFLIMVLVFSTVTVFKQWKTQETGGQTE